MKQEGHGGEKKLWHTGRDGKETNCTLRSGRDNLYQYLYIPLGDDNPIPVKSWWIAQVMVYWPCKCDLYLNWEGETKKQTWETEREKERGNRANMESPVKRCCCCSALVVYCEQLSHSERQRHSMHFTNVRTFFLLSLNHILHALLSFFISLYYEKSVESLVMK